MPMETFPKLDDQDDFLLYLRNNNYSDQTIINYARDLCIFAVFLYFRNTSFINCTKKDISMFKGYLMEGNHLKDLDTIRKNDIEKLRGSGRLVNSQNGMITPLNGSNFEDEYLARVYSKVYGSLGISEYPQNKAARKNGGLDPVSINRTLSAIRRFLKLRISWDLPIPMPPDAIEMMKTEKRVKKVASEEDLVRLIESPMQFEPDEKVALRNRCMLEMLFATGMRISELINLDLEQINVKGKLYILGKGKKERSVFMTDRSLSWLNAYLRVRLKFAFTDPDRENEVLKMSDLLTDRETLEEGDVSDPNSDLNLNMFDNDNRKYIKLIEDYRESGFLNSFDSPALFIPFSGRGANKKDARISTNYFQDKIAEYRRKLGIQIPTSAHSLRHGFATYLAENGASPAALQVLLGHASLNTTTRYVHASEKYAEETVEKLHPLQH